MRPYDAKADSDLMKLRRDIKDTDDFWILHAGDHITLAEQRVGEPAKAMLTIPRRDFNKLIRWYMRDQKQ